MKWIDKRRYSIIWRLVPSRKDWQSPSRRPSPECQLLPPVPIEINYSPGFWVPTCIFADRWILPVWGQTAWRCWWSLLYWRSRSWSLHYTIFTLLLLELQSLHQKLVDVLGLLVAEVGTEVLHEFDDTMLAKILVCGLLQGVVRHISISYIINPQIFLNTIHRNPFLCLMLALISKKIWWYDSFLRIIGGIMGYE